MITIYDLVEGTVEHIRARSGATTAPQATFSGAAEIDPALQLELQPALSPTASPATRRFLLPDVNCLSRRYRH